jgi:hypothetical protein
LLAGGAPFDQTAGEFGEDVRVQWTARCMDARTLRMRDSRIRINRDLPPIFQGQQFERIS